MQVGRPGVCCTNVWVVGWGKVVEGKGGGSAWLVLQCLACPAVPSCASMWQGGCICRGEGPLGSAVLGAQAEAGCERGAAGRVQYGSGRAAGRAVKCACICPPWWAHNMGLLAWRPNAFPIVRRSPAPPALPPPLRRPLHVPGHLPLRGRPARALPYLLLLALLQKPVQPGAQGGSWPRLPCCAALCRADTLLRALCSACDPQWWVTLPGAQCGQSTGAPPGSQST